MAEAPPVKPLQRTADDADLRMLALLHFAMAFLSVVGIGLLVWQYGLLVWQYGLLVGHDGLLAGGRWLTQSAALRSV